MRFAGWMALAVIGCSGGDSDEDPIEPPVEPPDDTSAPIDTAPEGSNIDAGYFLITARFAWDPETGLHQPFAEVGEGLTPIQVTVTLIDTSFAGALTDENSCTVTLEVAEPLPTASWVVANEAWTGFDVPATRTVRDTCQFYGLPNEFGGDPALHVGKWQYGAGVGPLDPDVGEQIRLGLPPSEWDALEPYIIGGFLSSNLFEGGITKKGFALGFEVDGNFEIVVDGVGNAEPIPGAAIDQEVGVARGYYEVTSALFEPGSTLTNEPL